MDDLSAVPGGLSSRRWTRLIPLFGVCMFVLYVDRYNIALAAPVIQQDLGLSNADIGTITGVFFLGSVIFQIPLLASMARFGGKIVIAVSIFVWGLGASASGLAQTHDQLVVARLVVGIGEAAFHPAMYVLIALWFMERERGRANSIFFSFNMVAGVVATPLTGLMLEHMSWHTVLVLQGLPAIVLAVVWLIVYNDRPSRVFWLAPGEGELIEDAVAQEKKGRPSVASLGYRRALLNPTVLLLMLIYGLLGGVSGVFSMWLPTVIHATFRGLGPFAIGALAAAPALVGGLVAIALGRFADRTNRYRSTVAATMLVGALGLAAGPLIAEPRWLQIVLLCVVASGCVGVVPLFYASPTWMLPSAAVGVGIGLINTTGALFGFASSYLVGYLADALGSVPASFSLLALLLGLGALLAAVVLRNPDSSVSVPQAPGSMAEIEDR
ncbi:MFS transporter [Pseudonocardia xishanensis]|uniref:MFS transporter n=1 Tax=Pseudonocardia xishanensis TaxID=630995 RepID=A0ABP8S008_9PSEU